MRRILVVDDDEDVLASMRDVLSFSIPGASVETANSGRRALEIVEDEGLDALVTDYRMPGMDGLELANEVRRTRPRLPVVMVTAYRDSDMEEVALEQGIRQVVHKPFDIEELVLAVESSLGAPR